MNLNKEQRKLASEVFEAAANKIRMNPRNYFYYRGAPRTHDACCVSLNAEVFKIRNNPAVVNVFEEFRAELRREFRKLFVPEDQYYRVDDYWWKNPSHSLKDQQARKIALLLMSQIYK